MSDEQATEFTLEDFMRTPREEFEVPQEVQDTLREMMMEINKFCLDNKIPFAATAVVSNDGSDYHLSSSVNFPQGRFPEEMLVMNEIARGGISGALSLLDVLADIIAEARKEPIIA